MKKMISSRPLVSRKRSDPQDSQHEASPNLNSVTSVMLQSDPTALSAREVLHLGGIVGNQGLQRMMNGGSLQRKPKPKAAPLPPGVVNVRNAITRGDYISQPTSQGAEGTFGAYYYLDRMTPTELLQTLVKLTADERALLIKNEAQGNAKFDMSRINTALRAASMQQSTAGQAAVELEDAIDDAVAIQTAQRISDAIKTAEAASGGWKGWIDENIIDIQAPYSAVYSIMAGLDEVTLQPALAHLVAGDVSCLISHLGDAPAAQRARWGTLLASLAGKSPASIPTAPFRSVFQSLITLSRVELYKRLRLTSRENRQLLLDHLNEVPSPSTARQLISEVLTDLQGTGASMEPDDVIDISGLKRTDLVMAQIYNKFGQFLEEQARALNITTAAAAGIMNTESGGQTFSATTDKQVIRFENHIFWDQWGHKKANKKTFNDHFQFNQEGGRHLGHMWRDKADGEWVAQHAKSDDQEGEWAALNKAASLSNQETAYLSMSMGAGQIMGFNHDKLGYSSAVEMYNAFAVGERTQIRGIFDYIAKTKGLAEAIRKGDYRLLAKLYNGAGTQAKQDEYQKAIGDAAASYEKVTKGKKHVYPAVAVPAAAGAK